MIRLAILLVILFNASCYKLPEKPSVFLCTYRAVDSIFVCARTTNEDVVEVKAKDAQGFVAFSPSDWSIVMTYINLLKDEARKSCN